LCGNSLTQGSCVELVSVLGDNAQLTSLDLGNNRGLGDAGLDLLCQGLLQRNCQLERLGLRNNRLTSASGPKLALAIRNSWSLTHLDLNDNSLKDSGLLDIYRCLKDPNCRIQSLKLDSNDLTEECCRELGSALAENQTVKELSLNFNPLGDSGLQVLQETMRRRGCTLHTL
ncbi:NACHT, LRR and PYD domains-containing protein 3-like, partial [Mustelus asterias]